MADRFVLGTVQLGLPYGIGNRAGKPDFQGACAIVAAALENGIVRFDTAQAYGDSEEVLGRVFAELQAGPRVKVYSKLHPRLDLRSARSVRRSVSDSLRKLRIDRLEGLLLHHEDGLQAWGEGLGETLRGLAAEGKVGVLGASFYSPRKAVAALDLDGIGLVQVPANILDRRFEDAGVFRTARERGREVFVRSVFLQGLLLLPLDRIPATMDFARPRLERTARLARDLKLSLPELALSYACRRWPQARIIFGADSPAQVRENVAAAGRALDDDLLQRVARELSGAEEALLNPSLWPK